MDIKTNQLIGLVASVLFICSCSMSAQYKSIFGNSHTSWNVLIKNFPITLGGFTESIVVSGDSVLGSYSYKKIRAQIFGNSGDRYAGLLREDTMQGKVWFVPPYAGSGGEELIMDLGLGKGDSFSYSLVGSMISVDSVYYVNGRKNIRFDYYQKHNPSDSLQFEMMEGIGPNYGVINGDTTFSGDQTLLLCSYKDSARVFTNTFHFGDCVFSAIGLGERRMVSKVKVYPNPAKDFVTIDCEDREGLEGVRLYNVNGVLLRELSLLQRNIDVSDLPHGVYFLVFDFERENVSKRIVIE